MPDSTIWQNSVCLTANTAWSHLQPPRVHIPWAKPSSAAASSLGFAAGISALTQTKQRLSRHQLLNKAPHSNYLHISSVLNQPEPERVAGRLQGDVGGQSFTPGYTKLSQSQGSTPSTGSSAYFCLNSSITLRKPLFFTTANIRCTQIQQFRSINSASVCAFYLHSDVGHETRKVSDQVSFLVWFPFSHGQLGPSRQGCVEAKQHPRFYSEHSVLKIL